MLPVSILKIAGGLIGGYLIKETFDEVSKYKDVENMKNGGLSNEFQVNDPETIEKYNNKIILKNDIETLLKEMDKTTTQSEQAKLVRKDIVVITMELNDVQNANVHAKNVKGIIDTRIKDINNDVASFYLPKNKNDDKLTYIEYLNTIKNNLNNKIVFINESFGEYIEIDNLKQYSLDSVFEFKDKINELKKRNEDLIYFLNQNQHISISKAAGNYSTFIENRDILLENFQMLSNNDYETMQTISLMLNLIIENKINGKENLKESEEFLKNLKEICQFKNINYDNFINLYIKDYLLSYERIDLLNKSKNLNQSNEFHLKQLNIVEALDLNIINENIKTFKKYNKNEDLTELENDIKNLNINGKLQYNNKNIKELEVLYLKYAKKYPEIFEITKFGNLSNLIYKNGEVLKTSIDGHNGVKLSSSEGTSYANPTYITNYIEEYKKFLNINGYNIKNVFEAEENRNIYDR